MSYQRFGEPAKPEAYIWASPTALHLCAEGETHDGTHYRDGVVEIVFPLSDKTTAENLFVALYEHLTGENVPDRRAALAEILGRGRV